ncbi:MAG: RHS repeat-associated core domain-containing protein [bacterium]
MTLMRNRLLRARCSSAPPTPGFAPSYGVVLWATNEDTDGHAMQFNSSEAASNQPYLEIIWSNTPKTVYFLKDHLGSVRATVLDSATAPVIGYDDYDPWGYPLAGRTKAIPNAYLQGASKNKFTGQEWDDEHSVNWLYFPERSYESQSARWLSADPFAKARPWESPYLYVGGNPIVRVDLEGLYWIDTNGDRIPDTWVIEEPTYAISEPQNEEAIIRPRYGRLFGLGFLAVGEAIGHNDFFRAWTGTDPFSTQQISNTERVVSGILAATTVAPLRLPLGLKNASQGLKHLFSNGSIRGMSIIEIRTTLINNGFKQTVTRNGQGYLFKNSAGENIRIMSRGGKWDIRVQNQFGNYLNEFGNVAGPSATHNIEVFSR